MFPSQAKRIPRFWGFFLLGLGLVLLGIPAAYWGYGLYARSQIPRLEVSVPLTVPIFMPSEEGGTPAPTPAAGEEEPPAVVGPLPVAPEETAIPGETQGSPTPESPPTASEEPSATPAAPEEPAPSALPPLPQEGSASDLLEIPPQLSWIRIPDIEVDSKIVELSYTYDDGRLTWERPKHAVGHLKETAEPGQVGNSVLVGHLQSPIRHEGAVFRRLPEIAALLTLQGEGKRGPVDIIIFTPAGQFVYRVVETEVDSPQMILEATSEPTLTLITCWPEWIYDKRFVVTAKLIDAALLP